jgi:hypothetical protein
MHAAERSLLPDDQCPCLQRPSRCETGGLPLPPGGSATNNAMSIPTASTCFRSRGGHLNHWKDSNTVAIAVIVLVAIVTVVVPIVVVIAITIVITVIITVVAGCCHCCQDNKSLTVFDISYAFLHTETGGCCQRLHHWVEGDGSGKPKAWEVAPRLPEGLRFCGFFGVSAEVLVTAWDMMENHSVLPPTSKFLHFLWVLAFMRTYPANNTTLSSLLGGSNPKTISKYVWPFIWSIFALNKCLVS